MLKTKFQKRQRAQQAAAVVGVDAGKRKHALVVRPRGGLDSKPIMFESTRAGFEKAMEEIRAQAPGAGPGGRSLPFGKFLSTCPHQRHHARLCRQTLTQPA